MGHVSQHEFAKGNKIAPLEKVLHSPFGLRRNIDFPFFQPLKKLFQWDVNDLNLISPIEKSIGQGLLHANSCDLFNDIVQTLKVLNIHRGVNINATVKQLFNILVSFWMSAARSIGVCKFIDQNNRRPSCENGIEIHFFKDNTLIFHTASWNHFQILEQCLRLDAAVSLYNSHDDVLAALLQYMGFIEHGIGFSHTRRVTEKYL